MNHTGEIACLRLVAEIDHSFFSAEIDKFPYGTPLIVMRDAMHEYRSQLSFCLEFGKIRKYSKSKNGFYWPTEDYIDLTPNQLKWLESVLQTQMQFRETTLKINFEAITDIQFCS